MKFTLVQCHFYNNIDWDCNHQLMYRHDAMLSSRSVSTEMLGTIYQNTKHHISGNSTPRDSTTRISNQTSTPSRSPSSGMLPLTHRCFCPEDGGNIFLWNVGSHKAHTQEDCSENLKSYMCTLIQRFKDVLIHLLTCCCRSWPSTGALVWCASA